jgi:hypothetical protein
MDVFQREQKAKAGKANRWTRACEEHIERAYLTADLCQWLAEAGFTGIEVYADRRLTAPEANEQRIFISAQRPSIPH